jgi:hypothetical protein
LGSLPNHEEFSFASRARGHNLKVIHSGDLVRNLREQHNLHLHSIIAVKLLERPVVVPYLVIVNVVVKGLVRIGDLVDRQRGSEEVIALEEDTIPKDWIVEGD